MRALINAYLDAVNDGGTGTRDAVALMIAFATWLGSFGLIWQMSIGSMLPANAGALSVTAALVPAFIMFAVTMVISELKGWY